MSTGKTIYLDHAASTSVLPEVQTQLPVWLAEGSANPSSIHNTGREAARQMDQARSDLARVIGAKREEILFTSGGTEANNLALLGLAAANRSAGDHIISCATEHPSVLESLKHLENEGFSVSYLSVNANGEIDLDELRSTITDRTLLISLMWVNNETGLIHPVHGITKIAQETGILTHIDAAQALGHVPIRVDELPADVLTFSGHKLGTPAGIGFLYRRNGTALKNISFGGSQESSLRAGTQNLLGARALALAAQINSDRFDRYETHFTGLAQHLVNRLSAVSSIRVNRNGSDYSPHIVNCSVANVDGEALFIRLDLRNISVSNGSACSSGSQAPSHVLTAMGIEKGLAQASLRISFGLNTSIDEIDIFCNELASIVDSLQKDRTA